MHIGVKYVVTKASLDGTFEVGDHIMANKDMTITCFEAEGWIEKKDVVEATRGMEYVVDKEWVQKKKEKILSELAFLDNIRG